jgi:hypothetical protein
LTSRGLFTKISSWQGKQSIRHTTVTFYGDCVKMCEDFAPNFSDKRTGCWITTMHPLTLPFSPGNFWPETTLLLSLTHPTCLIGPLRLFWFPDWRRNWKAAILTQLRWWRQNRRRCWTLHRTRLPGCI